MLTAWWQADIGKKTTCGTGEISGVIWVFGLLLAVVIGTNDSLLAHRFRLAIRWGNKEDWAS